ncbi:MAG: ABC transporter ATP-binding protein, partial [Olsenella sp.]|nr:ABC transporter ATP-binding protein [Olsenella sp.]
MERLATSAAVPAIEVTGLSFAYPAAGGAAATPVLDGVSLQVAQGEFCLLCGRTGSGKT